MKNIHPRFFYLFFKGNDQRRCSAEARGAVPPPNGCLCPRLTAACAPHFGLLKILFLEHHTTTRQQTVMEKLLYINQTQYSFLLTRLYGCVAKETCKPAES